MIHLGSYVADEPGLPLQHVPRRIQLVLGGDPAQG